MNIKDFKYAWRYTDSNYAVFSSDEISKMCVLSVKDSSDLWDKVCDSEAFEKSSYIQRILNKNIPIYVSNCGWGEISEEITKNKLIEFFEKNKTDRINLLYVRTSSLNVSSDLFCNKWSDFCYPSDSILILNDLKLLIYYEDILYGPFIINK